MFSIAPQSEAPGQSAQAALVGEADRTVHLVGDLGELAGGFAGEDRNETASRGHSSGKPARRKPAAAVFSYSVQYWGLPQGR